METFLTRFLPLFVCAKLNILILLWIHHFVNWIFMVDMVYFQQISESQNWQFLFFSHSWQEKINFKKMGTCSQTLSFRQDIELKHHKEHISSNMVQKGYTPRIYHNLPMLKNGLKCRLVSCIQSMKEFIKIWWNQASIVTI